jgi:hypothetical protein
MEIIGLVLVVAGLGVLVAVVVSRHRLRRDLLRLEDQARALAIRMDALPPELARAFGTGARHIITVELLNLFELAHRESVLTRPLTALTPRLVRDIVHRKLVGKVRESLADAGVEADVRLHRAG